MGAVSQRSNSTVQFLCQGFLGFLPAPTACTDRVKSFVFSITDQSKHFAEYHTAFKVEKMR